jgi:hypothetical protein
MAGQVSQNGAMSLANHLGGVGGVVIQTTMPTFVPGLIWINDSTSPPVQMVWNSETWVDGPEQHFVALLTGDPSQAGQGGGYAETVADIAAVEDTTPGYTRQPVTFAPVPAPYSSSTAYVVGNQVSFEGFVYTNAVASTNVAPTGAESSNSTWTYTPNGGYPGEVANSNVLTWGPYTAAQALPVQWAALVTVSSGTVGLLKYMWILPAPQQVNISQSIQAGVGSLILAES